MRVTSAFWVGAYLRRCQAAGAFGAVARRGALEAGAIFIKVNRLDGSVLLLSPAPQALLEEVRRAWLPHREGVAISEAEADRFIASEQKFDPDLWLVEIEDRAGRTFLLPDELASPSDGAL